MKTCKSSGSQLPFHSALPLPMPMPCHCPAGDIRTVDKLTDGTSNTMDDTHMWLAPIKRQLSSTVVAAYQRHQQHGSDSFASNGDREPLPEAARPFNLLAIRLPAGSQVAGLRLWNYNKSPQDTARGVKRMLVLAGGWVRALRGSDWLMIASRWLWIAVRLMLCMTGFLAHRLPVTPLSCRWCGSVPARWRAGAACPRHCSF